MKLRFGYHSGRYSFGCTAEPEYFYLARFLESDLYLEDEIDRVLGYIAKKRENKLPSRYYGGGERYALMFKGQKVMFVLNMHDKIAREPHDEGELPLDLFEKILVAWRAAVIKSRKMPKGYAEVVEFPDPK